MTQTMLSLTGEQVTRYTGKLPVLH